jgi:O-antigen/teichoic acid export membrane protein
MIAGVTLVANAGLNVVLIPSRGLVGAAIGTTAAMLFGTVIASSYLLWRFGTLVPWLSIVRISAAAAMVYAGSLAVPAESRLLIIAKLGVLSLAYAAMLVLSREIGKDDLRLLRKVINPQSG